MSNVFIKQGKPGHRDKTCIHRRRSEETQGQSHLQATKAGQKQTFPLQPSGKKKKTRQQHDFELLASKTIEY